MCVLFLCGKICYTVQYVRGLMLIWCSAHRRNGEQVRSCSEMQTWLCLYLKGSAWWQRGRVWIRVKVQRLGAPLVTHLAPSIEAKEAGGNPCHCVQQGPQGLSRGYHLTDLHSDDPVLHLVVSFSRLDIECAHFWLTFSSCLHFCKEDWR